MSRYYFYKRDWRRDFRQRERNICKVKWEIAIDIFGYKKKTDLAAKIKQKKWNEMRLTRWAFTIVRLQRTLFLIEIVSQ